jgi:spermidine synthase
MQLALLLSIFIVAICGLVYELIAGALASYVLGDTLTQFSTVIGAYLFAMGIGSHLSKYVRGNLVAFFIRVEILVGLVGGASAMLLFLDFEHMQGFRVLLYGLVGVIGILVGCELPVLMRILKDELPFKDLVSRVFTVDYVGALLASVLFPLVLAPRLGLMRTAFLFGILNVGVALWALRLFAAKGGWTRPLAAQALVALALLGAGFVYSDRLMSVAEAGVFPDPVVIARNTPYQRLVLTRSEDDMRLYLNGNLQFSSRDEHRYHEALVHVGLASMERRQRVLVLGGGDGLAVREVLRYPDVETVTLVDLDPEMTELFRRHEMLVRLNGASLSDPRVRVVNADAFQWLREGTERFDFVVVDFPDPSNFSLGKLYSTAFYQALGARLAPGGAFVVQSTSPWVARRSFWCVAETMEQAGFAVLPYHANVPSFGEWGFLLGARAPMTPRTDYPAGLRFLDAGGLAGMLAFPPDMARLPVEANRLNNQILVRYFDDEWSQYVR